MTRLPLIEDDAADASTRAVFAAIADEGRGVPDLYRLIANAPGMLKAWTDLAWPLRGLDHIPRSLRELVIMRTAYLVQARYEWAHHWPMALSAGVTLEQLKAVPAWRASAAFSAAECAALALADEIVERGHASDAVFAGARAHFEGGALVQLVLTASFYVCVARFAETFEVGLEPHYKEYPPLPPKA